jgi:hypothetical protein
MYVILAFVFALVAPLALIATRRELQRVRTAIMDDLRATIFHAETNNSQINLARSRYMIKADDGLSGRQAAVMAWTGAGVFTLVCFAGFLLLLVPISALFAAQTGPDLRIVPALLWANATDDLQTAWRTAAIGGFGFLGSYIFQIRYLTRATLNQELGALTFVRSAIGVIVGIVLAIVLYRAAGVAGLPDILASGADIELRFGAMLGIAFAVGYWPDIGLARIARWLKVQAKLVDTDALKRARIAPPEVIDGIDTEISYRLQKSGLFDVQNLATANPLTLYAETPYGIFQCFDWVLQAQLFLGVGADCYDALRRHNIRTIFDLERAVLAQGAPADYVRAIGAIVLSRADPQFRARIGLPDGEAPTISVGVVRHIVAIMGDDLHVHRLRQLWSTILKETTGNTDYNGWLYATGPLPGDGCPPEVEAIVPARDVGIVAEPVSPMRQHADERRRATGGVSANGRAALSSKRSRSGPGTPAPAA